MKKILLTCLLLTGCATQNAMPLGNDLMQVDVSAAPIYGRAGAQRMAMTKAAQATLNAGYDKFIVVGNQAWNETTAGGGSYGQYNGGTASWGGGWGMRRNPESTLVIRMFKAGQKGSEKAIDARELLASQ